MANRTETTTDDRILLLDFVELVERDAGGDLARELPAFAAGRLTEMEISAAAGAAKGERSADRSVYRSGYRELPLNNHQPIENTY